MSKRYKIMAISLLVLLTLLVVVQASQPDPINWFQSFSKKDKIPFGTYIFYDQLEKQIPSDRIVEVKKPPFEFLTSEQEPGTYFFVNNSVYFDEAETKKMLNWLGTGNTLFVSATSISKVLLDTLNLSTAYFYDKDNLKKIPLVNLSNPGLESTSPYKIEKDIGTVYFKEIDTLNTTILGVYDLMVENDSTNIKRPKINCLKIPFKSGNIILHTFPEAFTNYFLLEGNNMDYVSKLLAYIPKEGKLYLDQYYKSGKTFNTSPLYLILNNKYLKWAYYIIIIIALLWVYFEGKRKQRSIPVVKPLPNQTVSFTKTIAGMYLEKKENKQIVLHQVNHFLQYLRDHYSLSTAQLGSDFISKVAAKSGKPQEEVKKLIDYLILIRQKDDVSENELIQLNKMIENFKK
tara:strand:- start:1516 stop:2724 length:1209 start_codon:yes stop_codon:yes gene_type:complete